MMKGEQQKIFHKGLNEKINAFITLLYPSNKIKFKISKSRISYKREISIITSPVKRSEHSLTNPHLNSPEGKARELIDKRLEESGWTIIRQGNPVPNRGNFAVEEVGHVLY